jgi:hypothetical protein
MMPTIEGQWITELRQDLKKNSTELPQDQRSINNANLPRSKF